MRCILGATLVLGAVVRRDHGALSEASPEPEQVVAASPDVVVPAPVDPALRVVGRALDRNGRPLDSARLELWLRPRSSQSAPIEIVYDATGAFAWTPRGLSSLPLYCEIETPWEGEWLIASTEIPARQPGEHDLGELVFRPAPPLVSGRVVRATGEPISSARILFASQEPGSLRYAFSEADGRFAFHREAAHVHAGAKFAVLVRSVGHADTRLDVALHTDVGDVVLHASGELVGRVLLAMPVPDEALAVEIRLQGAAWLPARTNFRAPLHADGSFRIRDVPPGTHEVRLTGSAWVGPPLTVLEAVDVRPGSPTVIDEASDLSEVVREISFEIVDSGGTPLTSIRSGSLVAGSDGRFRLFHGPQRGSFPLGHEGHLTETVQCDDPPSTIRLRAAPRVSVRFVGHERLPLEREVELRASGVGHMTASWAHAEIDHDGRATLELGSPGVWQISARWSRGAPPDAPTLHLATIDTERDGLVHELEFHIPERFLLRDGE